MTRPFNLLIDDTESEVGLSYTEGQRLHALTKYGPELKKWTKNTSIKGPLHVFLFSTPTREYLSLEEHMNLLNGNQIVMGVLPHLTMHSDTQVQTALEPDTIYDVMTTGVYHNRRVLAGASRIVTTLMPSLISDLTFEECQLLALEDLGLKVAEAKRIKATISPMTAWNQKLGRLRIVGFEYQSDESLLQVGSQVSQMGDVTRYRNVSASQIKAWVGAKSN